MGDLLDISDLPEEARQNFWQHTPMSNTSTISFCKTEEDRIFFPRDMAAVLCGTVLIQQANTNGQGGHSLPVLKSHTSVY